MEARILRENFVFYIIPMLNIDGKYKIIIYYI